MILGVDVESTGLDTFHGCRPYLVTTCDDRDVQRTWQWQVDPKTRKVLVDKSDVGKIQNLLDSADKLVFHNAKFDLKMLGAIGINLENLWHKVEDTLFMAHMLSSQENHDLTSVVKKYLDRDIKPFETKMETIVQTARRLCRSRVYMKDWKLASDGLTDGEGYQLLPSTRGNSDKEGKAWMADTWLPECIARFEGEKWTAGYGYENWLTAATTYADVDSSCLIPLISVMWEEVLRRRLDRIYRERLKILPVVHRMEHHGITYKLKTHLEMVKEFTEKSNDLEQICIGIAEEYNYKLELPKRGRNKNLDKFVFEVMGLPVLRRSESKSKDPLGNPVFDTEVKEEYELTLPEHSLEQKFIKILNEKSEYDTALGYLRAYERFCIRDKEQPILDHIGARYATLYPNLNPTGTIGLRFSHNNPNQANVSKHKKTNLRKCFGPREGRIWYSCDYTGIELAIPAYEANEVEMAKVFDNPEEPPYYGSYHLLIFDTLHPELFKKHGKDVKTLFEDSWYQWTKNGSFARQYGAQEKKVDQTYRVSGGYHKIASRFPRIDKLSKDLLRLAEKQNYVSTIPDTTIDPERGFPIQAKRGYYGKVEPTTPLCYHVSSTAAQVLNKAMVLCDQKLTEWRSNGFDAWMILTVHDELVFDFPIVGNDYKFTDSRANEIRSIMESASKGINIPIRVSVERHAENWATGGVLPRTVTSIGK
jgi:DNA polymerase I-like protein with 3'-5' exonuclease and polymerase domains